MPGVPGLVLHVASALAGQLPVKCQGGFLLPSRVCQRSNTHTHAPHTKTPGWPRGAPSCAGLLSRHLPLGEFQTSHESQKLHELQTPESMAGPGPLLSAWDQKPTKGQSAQAEGTGRSGTQSQLPSFPGDMRPSAAQSSWGGPGRS
jgi:hypothetical protein